VISFVVPGKPLSINRAYRVARFGGRGGLRKSEEAEDFQYRVKVAAKKAMRGRAMLTGDLVLRLVAYWPRRGADSDAPTKLTKDALQGIVYENDRIVIEDQSRRGYDPERPRVEITLTADEAP
jgi:Holliday junction resolvase RusA-like endonuclease